MIGETPDTTIIRRFRHGGLPGGSWTYQHDSGPVSYYLNFL
jgi:hypothetical protein